MNKRILIVPMLTAAACLLAAGPVLAKENCAKTTAMGVTDGIAPDTLHGWAQVSLDGEAPKTYEVYIYLTDTKATRSDNLIVKTRHVFFADPYDDGNGECDLNEDCFETIDHGVLQPIDEFGLFRINSNMKIIDGEGAFADACGQLHAQGEIQFGPDPLDPPHSVWTARGKLCSCPSTRS